MPANNHWMYQGRQYHQWFGHGTAPKEDPDPIRPGSLFDAASIAQRLDYAVGHVVGAASRNERSRWETRLGGTARESLKTLVAAWYGARGKSRDTFRGQLLDPYTSDETVDQLRVAVEGIVEGRTHDKLGAAGEALASAAFKIGLDAWPRFLGDSQRRAMDAVSAEVIPGVIKASATGTDTAVAGGALLLGLLYLLTRPPPASKPPVSKPMMTEQSPPAKKKEEKPTSVTPELAKPGEATLADDRRKYILDGDGKGGGGHGPGRGMPGKSEFPPNWSDEKAIEAVTEVANDPASERGPSYRGRTVVHGTREGVDIEVIVGADGKTIINAYPTNVPRNPNK